MVPISRHCPYGVDKAVQISRAVFFFDKGTQPKLPHKQSKTPYYSGYQIFMPGSFEFNFSENCNIALRYMHSQLDKICLVVLTFKMAIKF